ncbi:MAG: acetoin utilization protein AcuC [Gammaproteobacteria bacterium]
MSCLLVSGEAIAAYGFGAEHPFGLDRHDAFMTEVQASPVFADLQHAAPRRASRDELEYFHTRDYVDRVADAAAGLGPAYLDGGDTPAFPGVYDIARDVVGASLVATDAVLNGEAAAAFVPIAGLHHAARDTAAGFCVFNDCAIAIEHARRVHGLTKVAYVDIDAHHGDGVYYGFEADAGIIFADIHEDGRYLYPGTGASHETGRGEGEGMKLNLPLPPGADDAAFLATWPEVEAHLLAHGPQFIVLQCGADSIAGDPITHLAFSEQAHYHAAARLMQLSRELDCRGVLGLGGGGYNRTNLARGWTRVVEALASEV